MILNIFCRFGGTRVADLVCVFVLQMSGVVEIS